jgi:hypothetical protein
LSSFAYYILGTHNFQDECINSLKAEWHNLYSGYYGRIIILIY